MGIVNRVFYLIFVVALVNMGLFPASIVNAADFQFDQGAGYEPGAYDREAAQPTAFNWTRQSQFTGSSDHDVKWSFETEDRIYSTPAIGAGGTIYIGSYDGNLYALDSETGKLKWTFETDFSIASSPAIGADGTIYIGSGDGKLYALDPNAENDGRMKWSFETDDSIYSSPAIGEDGTIYVSSYDGWLYALNPEADVEDERELWSYEIGGETDSSPAIGVDGMVYVGSGDGFFYALDPKAEDEEERMKWSLELNMEWDGLCWDEECPIYSSPVIDADGIIYIGSSDGYVYALDPKANDEERIKWSFDIWGSVLSSPAIGADGTVYVGSFDGALYALDPNADNDDEREKWSFETATNLWTTIISSPVIGADGTIYIGSSNGKLYALDPKAEDENKREKWSFESEGEIHSSPVIGPGGTVYIGSFDQQLYAIGTRSIEIPHHVEATASRGAVSLSWETVEGAAGYQVYMYKGTGAPARPDEWNLINDELITESNYTATGLEAGQLYWFAIKAVDAGGMESDFSELVSATIPRSSSGGGSSGSSGGSYLSSNANLKAVEIWADDTLIPLEPTFSKDILSYTVETKQEQIEVKAVAEHTAAEVSWQDQVVGDGVEIDLKEGENVIPLSVQAEDGTRKTYTLTIERTIPQPVEPEPEPPEFSFTDIANHWAENYIDEAVMKSIINGYPDGTFKPNHPVTRAEFTVMLMNAQPLNDESTTFEFTDQEQIGMWAKQAVAQAVRAGIINGYEDNSFRPNANITRAEMAVMIARAMNVQLSENPSTTFADDKDIPQWAKSSIEAIHKFDIVNGRSGNRFVPKDLATRAEATVMLLRMLEQKDSQ